MHKLGQSEITIQIPHWKAPFLGSTMDSIHLLLNTPRYLPPYAIQSNTSQVSSPRNAFPIQKFTHDPSIHHRRHYCTQTLPQSPFTHIPPSHRPPCIPYPFHEPKMLLTGSGPHPLFAKVNQTHRHPTNGTLV